MIRRLGRAVFRRGPGSIAGGAVFVLLIGLLLSHLISIAVYHADLERQLAVTADRELIERMASIIETIAETDPDDRANIAHTLAWPSSEIHWSRERLIKRTGTPDTLLNGYKRRLVAMLPGRKATDVIVTYDPSEEESDTHHLLVAVRLADGSWVNFAVSRYSGATPELTPLAVSTSIMAVLVAVVSIVLVRQLTRPLGQLAAAAKRLGTDVAAPPLAETGPDEVREAAHAFNEMQARIRKLIGDRTQMLAAISHDLKTPITRLRLRAEYVEDAAEQEKMLRDLDEMEAMIASTLAFLRDDTAAEETRRLDLASVLESLCADQKDAGHDVSYEGRAHLPLSGRPLSLKRAFANLIDNAVMYGGMARVRLEAPADGQEPGGQENEVRVEVQDRGPGIPVSELENVFRPFHRIESSRSRRTGGVGLGLTVARSIIRAHGGDITLVNLPEGGLAVRVILPKTA